MVSSTGTFVSCKDYDDDIDEINKELTDLKSKLSDLESKVMPVALTLPRLNR